MRSRLATFESCLEKSAGHHEQAAVAMAWFLNHAKARPEFVGDRIERIQRDVVEDARE